MMRWQQKGVALLSAMLTVALVASLAAAALWQQWRGLEVEAAERSRLQSVWVLYGALDWARLILREDARTGGADHLAEPWAIPLEEARLSTFLAADKNNTLPEDDRDVAKAFLAGRINDMQSRMNVSNLVDGNAISAPSMQAFTKLFTHLGLPQSELAVLADNLLIAQDTTGKYNAQAALMPQRVEQLVWLGISERSLALLQPYITVLPMRTPVNLNTASTTVLYASIASLTIAQAQELANKRMNTHFRTLAEVANLISAEATELSEAQHSVSSRFFEVQGRLRLGQAIVEERSLVQRNGLEVKPLWSDKGTARFTQAPTLQ
jgi:general secretion pathway protein K